MKGGYRLNSKTRSRRRKSKVKGRGRRKGRKTRRRQSGGGVGILASLKSLLAPALLIFTQKKLQNRKTARKPRN